VARRIEQHPDVVLRLMLGESRTHLERVGNRGLQVADLDIEMHHHLLTTWHGGPHGRHELRRGLNRQIGDPFRRRKGDEVGLLPVDSPAQHPRIEMRQGTGVGGIEHHPPIVTFRSSSHASMMPYQAERSTPPEFSLGRPLASYTP
jgi:hypothetical protein